MRQYAVRRHHVASQYPDLALLEDVVSPKVLKAMRTSSRVLMDKHVRHVLVGGLAVGAWGYPRWSKDVDYLVGDEAFVVHQGGIITFAEGVPISSEGIPIDSLSAGAGEEFLAEAVDRPIFVGDIPVAPIEALVYMKLKSPRQKDRVDVIELVKAGIDVDLVSAWLSKHAPEMARKFAHAVDQAGSEEHEG